MDDAKRDARRYEPHEAAAELGMSGANLRRLAPIYERVYGDLPRDARRGRMWTPEAIDHLKRARDAVRAGRAQSVQAALVAAQTGEDLMSAADGDALPAPNTLAEFIAEIRALRRTIEDQNRLLVEQGKRLAALESGEPYAPHADPPASHEGLTPTPGSESAQTVEEEPERAEPHSAPGDAQEGTERPQQRCGWLVPVDKLPWWQYVLGLFLVFAATELGLSVGARLIAGLGGPSDKNVVIGIVITLALAWGVPGVFGWWVGFRRSNPRFLSQVIPFGVLVGVAAVSGFLFYFYGYPGPLRGTFFTDLEDNWVLGWVLIPDWLLYVSGALIGNAVQRLLTGRRSGTTPASPLSRTTSASTGSRKAWTPRQQALLGFVGTIIAALISLFGSILPYIIR